jgi:ribonuclease P protein component
LPAKNSLPRQLSLKSRIEIDTLFKQGRRFQGEYCTVIWLPADSFAYGVFVSRKYGNAPKRNHIKRLCREAIRLGKARLMTPGRLAVLPKPADSVPSFEEIKTDVYRLLEELGKR